MYSDKAVLRSLEARLRNYPSIVYFDEIDYLRKHLADVAVGDAFLLQVGDCAESFSGFSESNILDTFRILLQMALIITFSGKKMLLKWAGSRGNLPNRVSRQ